MGNIRLRGVKMEDGDGRLASEVPQESPTCGLPMGRDVRITHLRYAASEVGTGLLGWLRRSRGHGWYVIWKSWRVLGNWKNWTGLEIRDSRFVSDRTQESRAMAGSVMDFETTIIAIEVRKEGRKVMVIAHVS
jgi:hypothetical protein